MNKIIVFPALLLIVIINQSLLCQTTNSTVFGVLKEKKSSEVVIGATVALFKDSSVTNKKPEYGAITNKYGFYSIPKVKNGVFYLTVRALGYSPFIKKITVKSNEDLEVNIKLTEKNITTKEVVVQADKEESPTKSISMISVSPELISKMPAIGGEIDVFRALQLLPGVKQASEISSGLYVRGGSPDQNLILLDGVVVYNPSHLGGFLSAFDGDALRDIKLIKGDFPAEYGGRLSSVLDMTMKEGSKEKIQGSAGISFISSHLTVEGPITENSSFMISGRRMYLDLIEAFIPKANQPPKYYFYDLNGKVNYDFSEHDRVFLSGYFGRDVLNSGGTDLRTNFTVDWGNSTANLRWMHIVSPTFFTNFSLIYTNYLFESQLYDTANTASNFSALSQIKDYVVRAEGQYFPVKDHSLKFGAEATNHTFSADASSDFVPGVKLGLTPNSTIKTVDAAIYAQDEWLITSDLSANVGGRLVYFQQGKYLDFEPRLSLAYALSDVTSIKASASESDQFLHLITRNDISLPTDLWFPSTANVKPSRAVQGTLGIETKFGENNEYLSSFEIYYKKMTNLYEYKDTASFTFGTPLESQFTSGWGDSYGGEIFINKRIGKFTGWIGYTLSWTKRYFAELNNGVPFYPRYDIRHDISIVTTFDLSENWEIGATWVYYSGQTFTVPTGSYDFAPVGWGSQIGDQTPYSARDREKFIYTERNGFRMAPYHKLDLNFMYKFQWFQLPWELSINIYNAYNHLNAFAVYIDTQYDAQGNVISKQFKQITLFPFIPSLALGCKF
ncbi:MAG: TonB-dependent receptor [FCB group bacterium]